MADPNPILIGPSEGIITFTGVADPSSAVYFFAQPTGGSGLILIGSTNATPSNAPSTTPGTYTFTTLLPAGSYQSFAVFDAGGLSSATAATQTGTIAFIISANGTTATS